ncbi:helix-turn-helix transcriptional regulator [Ralstonia solanacearum]|nr:AraC family transcriptional regulator [Ralstonia solanacearum]
MTGTHGETPAVYRDSRNRLASARRGGPPLTDRFTRWHVVIRAHTGRAAMQFRRASFVMNGPRPNFRLFHQTLRQISTGAGVKLNDIDCTPQENQLVVAESLPGLTLCVLLEAGGHSILADRSCIQFASDQVLLSFSPTASVSENYLPSQQKLRAIEAHFTAEALGKFDMAEIRQVFARIAAAARIKPAGPDSYLYQFPASSAIRAIAEQIFRCRALEGVQQLFLHSKAFELLSLTVETLLASLEGGKPQTMQRRDSRKLDRARELMLARLNHNWTLAELAQAVNLNERKLKEGFRTLYGNSVHAYLQEKRMQAAAQLLAQTELTITEVVLQTGYANPSHFSKLFRRYFGMSPREYARQNL